MQDCCEIAYAERILPVEAFKHEHERILPVEAFKLSDSFKHEHVDTFGHVVWGEHNTRMVPS